MGARRLAGTVDGGDGERDGASVVSLGLLLESIPNAAAYTL